MLKRLNVNPDGPPLPVEPVSTTLEHNMKCHVHVKYNIPSFVARVPFTALFLSHAIGLCCSMARVGHSGMAADELTENIEAAVQTVVTKLRLVSVASWRAV